MWFELCTTIYLTYKQTKNKFTVNKCHNAITKIILLVYIYICIENDGIHHLVLQIRYLN